MRFSEATETKHRWDALFLQSFVNEDPNSLRPCYFFSRRPLIYSFPEFVRQPNSHNGIPTRSRPASPLFWYYLY